MTSNNTKQTLVTFEYSAEIGCLIWTLPCIGLNIWAGINGKTLWLITGMILTFMIIKLIYDSYLDSKEFDNWIDKNTGTIILFYPANKIKQNEIKNIIGKQIGKSIKQMSYDKSKIRGDIKYDPFIKIGLGQLNRIYPNHPRLVQISGNSLVELIDLYELNKIEKLEHHRIIELIAEINTYA